jgi:hypothetical protein
VPTAVSSAAEALTDVCICLLCAHLLLLLLLQWLATMQTSLRSSRSRKQQQLAAMQVSGVKTP